jgi:hypothetical protein
MRPRTGGEIFWKIVLAWVILKIGYNGEILGVCYNRKTLKNTYNGELLKKCYEEKANPGSKNQ